MSEFHFFGQAKKRNQKKRHPMCWHSAALRTSGLTMCAELAALKQALRFFRLSLPVLDNPKRILKSKQVV